MQVSAGTDSFRRVDLLSLTPEERTAAIVAMGKAVGFDDVGVALPGPHPEMARFAEWLERGYHGEMTYMFRHRRRRLDPNRTQRGVKAVIVAALDYDTTAPTSRDREEGRGWISRYAWGVDYHTVIEGLLERWVAALEVAAPGHGFREYVDYGPVLEKVFARHAGLGWMGKHTNIINPQRGSYFFLASILTDLELAPGEPLEDRCGSCTACLDACPTQAFVAPYVLDARRCISYLTIESSEPIPEDLQAQLDGHLFGCDVCQEVCPWNRKPLPPNRAEFQAREDTFQPALEDVIGMSEAEFARRFDGTPVARRGLEGLQSTARVLLGRDE